MWEVTVIKLLVLSTRTLHLRLPWFWSLFAWNNLSPVLFTVAWTKLANMKVCDELDSNCDVTVSCDAGNINTEQEERRPLLAKNRAKAVEEKEENSEEDEEEEAKTAREKAVTIGRLIRYSRPDWHLMLSAFVFLCASSSGEYITTLRFSECTLLVCGMSTQVQLKFVLLSFRPSLLKRLLLLTPVFESELQVSPFENRDSF